MLQAATDAVTGLHLVATPLAAAALRLAEFERPGLAALLARREIGLVAAMAAVVIPVAFLNPLIFSEVNLRSLAMDAAVQRRGKARVS